jgi:oligoribonuclease
MTGLDVDRDHIIEMACVVTDGDLNVLATSPTLVIGQPKEVMDGMNEWCIEHHGKSGLTAAVLESKLTLEDAETQMVEFIAPYIKSRRIPLAGNSVHADRMFLLKEMPRFTELLSYRIIDVSSIKELAFRWNPAVADCVPRKALVG